MRSSISTAYRLAVQAQESSEAILVLVAITHPELPAPIYLCNAGANITSRGNIYVASFLQVTLVDEDPDRLPQAKLVLSNIQREMIAALRSTLQPPAILLEVVRASDPDYVEASLPNLLLWQVQGDAVTLQGDLLPNKVKAQPGSDYCFTPSYAPGLFS